MIDVEKFVEEAEKKPVYMYIYCYYDKQLDRFNTPIVDQVIPENMRDSCMAGLIKGKIPQQDACDLLLLHLGCFDIKTGKFDILPEPQIIVDCGRVIAEKIEKENKDA